MWKSRNLHENRFAQFVDICIKYVASHCNLKSQLNIKQNSRVPITQQRQSEIQKFRIL